MPWHEFIHWINVEYWSASWPNVFAPSFWTLLGMTVSHAHLAHRQRKHHDDLLERLNLKDKP
jgi:hypothetical protein